LRQKNAFFLAAHDFQPWNLEIAFEGNPGPQRFKQFWQLSWVLRNGPVTERFVWLNVIMIWKHVLYSLFVLLNGPASSCLSATRGSPW